LNQNGHPNQANDKINNTYNLIRGSPGYAYIVWVQASL